MAKIIKKSANVSWSY